MHLEGCHLCKCPYSKDVMTVSFIAQGSRSQFEGRLKVDILVAIKQTKEEEKLKKEIEFENNTTQLDFTVVIQLVIHCKLLFFVQLFKFTQLEYPETNSGKQSHLIMFYFLCIFFFRSRKLLFRQAKTLFRYFSHSNQHSNFQRIGLLKTITDRNLAGLN